MQFQQLAIEDFSGGMTDYPISRPASMAARNRNQILDVDARYATRPGSSYDGATDNRAKITSPVNGLLAPLLPGGSPYRLSTGGGFGKLFFDDGTTQTELVGPTGKHLFDAGHGTATDQRFSSAYWNGHHYITSGSYVEKPQKVYLDSSGVLQLRTGGLPQPTNSATITNSGGAQSWKYLFLWRYDYTVGVKTFTTRSLSRRFLIQSAGFPVVISGFPQWTGGTNDNFDTANIVMEIYRSESFGNSFYLLTTRTFAQVAANTPFSDSVQDNPPSPGGDGITLRLPFYANGGTTEVDDAPVSKFVHVTERGTGFYGGVKDSADVLPNRIFQSVPGIPDGVPRSFYVDLNDDVTGVSSFRGVPLFFDRANCYRGEGGFERAAVGNLIAKRFDESGGCTSHSGLVQTEQGVFFPGDDGFYWTDGYKKIKVSEEINKTWAAAYANDAAKAAIVGTYDPLLRLVYWTFTEGTNSEALFVLHLRFGVKPNAVFSIVGGNFDAVPDELKNLQVTTLPSTMTQNFRAQTILYTNQRLYRGDPRGYVFFSDPSKRTDPRVDTSLPVTSWGTQTIRYDYRTPALDFGSDALRKWTPSAAVKLRNSGDISVLVRSERDLEGVGKPCREIKHKTSVTWGENGLLWGDPALWESDRALYDDQRHLPTPGVRCTYRSLWVSNAFTVIQKSDNQGLITLGTGMTGFRTALLEQAGEAWATDIEDYFISFAADGYTNQYLVTARSNTTLTFSDPNGLAPPNGAGLAWQLKGFARGEILALKSIIIPYAVLDGVEGPYRPGTAGGNAT